MTDQEKLAEDLRTLFGSPFGRDCLQGILDYAAAFEAPGHLSTEELWMRQGARGLSLDIAVMAGALPEVPGSAGHREAQRHEQALVDRAPPEGDEGEEAQS